MALPTPTFSDARDACRESESLRDIRFWTESLMSDLPDWPTIESLNNAARRITADFRWTFILSEKVPSRAKSRGMSSLSGYVELISKHRQIPVRERNLHDFFNAVSFLIFPESKSALNERHLSEAPDGLKPGQNRTRVQDLLTMFDEGGVLRLLDLSGARRDLVFGHAVNEHLVLKQSIRAARLDFTINDNILSIPFPKLAATADRLFADWLKNEAHCRSGDEFSHVWIPSL